MQPDSGTLLRTFTRSCRAGLCRRVDLGRRYAGRDWQSSIVWVPDSPSLAVSRGLSIGKWFWGGEVDAGLSVVMPAFNEQATVLASVERVLVRESQSPATTRSEQLPSLLDRSRMV